MHTQWWMSGSLQLAHMGTDIRGCRGTLEAVRGGLAYSNGTKMQKIKSLEKGVLSLRMGVPSITS